MGARILVIEDNPANLELMRYLLSAFGHAVTTATDGEEGSRAIVQERPDLVICDLQLPRVDGFEVARRVKSDPALAALPLIAVTAFAMVGDRDRVLASGFDGYISKPLEPQSFIAQIDAFLAKAQRSQAPAEAAPARDSARKPHSKQDAALDGRHVLVVDDVAANRDLLRTVLNSGGYSVSCAENLEQARAAAKAHAPDVIVSDFHLRGESGIDLVEWVRSEPSLAHTPFMFVSSTVRAEADQRAGLERGADRFLLRPIEPHVLLEQVADCIRHGARP